MWPYRINECEMKGIKMNKELLTSITIVGILIVGLIIMFIFINRTQSNKTMTSKIQQKKTAQQFVNVKDIDDIFLYTNDGYILSYLQVHSISSDLLSDNEKAVLKRKLTNEFTEFNQEFKFEAVSRPIDIAPYITDYKNIIQNSIDVIQKQLLKEEIKVISDFSLSGEVVQREFFYVIWEKDSDNAEQELKNKADELAHRLNNAGMRCKVIKKQEIIKLCNLVNNPTYATIEGTNIDSGIPYIYTN